MLKVLVEKVNGMQDQVDNCSREMKTKRENWLEMLEMKNTVTEVKTAFDGLISKLDTAEESR